MVSSDRLVYKLLELVEQKTLSRGGNSMKKLRSIGCLIVLILSVLNLKIALGQGEENLNNDQDVTLEVDGGFLTLMIPAEYQYQTVELTELERYPFSYCSPSGMTVRSAWCCVANADTVSIDVRLSCSPYRMQVGTSQMIGCLRT